MDDCDDVAPGLPRGAGQLFMPRTQRQALAELVRAIVAGEPFVALTGDLGVGKTTVLNTAVGVLAERGLRIRRIDNPHGTPLRLPQIIGELLGNAPGTVTNEDIERLFDALTLSNNGGQLVLVFDDAHYLQADVLGYLQIVSSLHALGIRNQQVIFVGRPEFWDLLGDPKLCDLNERIKTRPVIEPLGEAEARDFLYYRLGQVYGAIEQHVSDAALSRLIHHGDGIPGRLDPILRKSLAAAGGYRLLGPETVDAGAYAVASGAPSVIVPAPPEEYSGEIVASHSPAAAMTKVPERRHRVLHPGALVCLAVLLAGSIGTVWHSSVKPNPREISGPATAEWITLPKPPTQTPIMLAASAASPPDASATSWTAPTGVSDPQSPATPAAVTSGRVDTHIVTVASAPLPVSQPQPVAASPGDTSAPSVAESLSAGAATNSGQDMSSPPQRGGDALTAPAATSPAHGPSPSADADARRGQPQNVPVAPASPVATAVPQPPNVAAAVAAPESAATPPRATDATVPSTQPPAAVAPASPAVTAVSQPPSAAAAVAAPESVAAPPRATDATVPSTQPPASSSAAAAVATQTSEPADAPEQAPNAPPQPATTPSTTASPSSSDAPPRSAGSEHTPTVPAANPEVPVSPSATGSTVLATQRNIVPGSVMMSPSARPEAPQTEATAPAAPSPAVPVTPVHLETLVPPAAGTPAPPAPAPADAQAAPQPASLSPEIVADLIRRGDAMLAIGDVSSARLLYSRAAESGDARAATRLAKTYDPLFLTKIGAWGMPTDATTAVKWYRRAAVLGDAEAAEQLKRLAEAGQ